MRETDRTQQVGKRRASVSATVVFLLLSALLVYGAVRWMGGTLVRFLAAPESIPTQTPAAAAVRTEPTPLMTTNPEVTASVPAMGDEETQQTSSSLAETLPSETASGASANISPESESTAEESAQMVYTDWSGTHYAAAFAETWMDVVIVLADGNGLTESVCILALRGDVLQMLAVPANSVLEDGRLLSEIPAERAVEALRTLLPVNYEKYIVLPRDLLKTAVDAAGPLRIAGQELDGAGVESYLSEAADAPLLRAERFSHLLCAIPERIRSLSILRLFRIKSDLENAVKTNIEETEGWQLCNAVRGLTAAQIMESTLPVESETVSEQRVYRPNTVLTEKILKNLYETSEKIS